MGRGRSISPYLKAKMREKREMGATVHQIAKEFGVSKRTVFRACKKSHLASKQRGRPRMISPSDGRKLAAKARESPTKSARVLASSLNISASVRTVQRELRRRQFSSICVRKRKKVPATAIAKRLSFAKEHLPKGAGFWERVIFSDEKKWNLQGNDGYVRIWAEKTGNYTVEVDLRRRPGVMVWGAVCANGARYIQRITGTINAEAYQNLLAEEIFNQDLSNLPENFIFQQDNAPAHAARTTTEFLNQREIPTLSWPPYSPDLNIIENMWAIVSRRVYEEGREYQTTEELWESVSRHFLEIPDETVASLFRSIPERLISVVELHGKRTHY